MNKRMLGILIIILWMGGSAYAQESTNEKAKAPTASMPSQSTNKSAKEKRIIILGTTIVGSLVKPRTVYEVPWKEPESLKKGLDTPQRSFQDEIFIPIDKEQFESQKGSQ